MRGRATLNRLTGGRFSAVERMAGSDGTAHRSYVGGHWDEIGKLQLDFLVSRGLRPEHVFLDIACGSLRGGVHLIPYLDRGNYLGIDKERSLVDLGLAKELPRAVRKEKAPEFVISNSFEFDRFSKQPDISLAQSLFTHILPEQIELCLGNLRSNVPEKHEAYVTFHNGESDENPAEPGDLIRFQYTTEQMTMFGERHGWSSDYIGEWNHPRGQVMMRFIAS